MSRQKMSLFTEWWNDPEEHDFCLACSPGHCHTQSMRSCGEFFFGPHSSVPRDVIQFKPPTKASLDEIPIYLSSAREPGRFYESPTVFLGDRKLRATVPKVCIKGYRGMEEKIHVVGIWHDLDKGRVERADQQRKRAQEDMRYEPPSKRARII
jgi:hypothetical protein